MEYSQSTACLLISECVCGAAGVVSGTGASRDWTLSSGVSGRADPWAQQECGGLISSKGAVDSERKANVSAEDTDVLSGIFLLLWLADLKLRCRYPVTPTVMEAVI